MNPVRPSEAVWRKSTRSGANGNCVEVTGDLPGSVAVRDSKNPEGPMLIFTREQWLAFTVRTRDSGSDLR